MILLEILLILLVEIKYTLITNKPFFDQSLKHQQQALEKIKYCIMGLPGLFLSLSSKNKTINPEKTTLHSGKKNVLSLGFEKLLYFLIFQETETPKQFFIFQETETIKSFLYFRECNFSAKVRKKKFHSQKITIFRKMELSCSILRNFFPYIFSKESFSYELNKT